MDAIKLRIDVCETLNMCTSLPSCSIGVILNEECHKTTYCRNSTLTLLKALTPLEYHLLQKRTRSTFTELTEASSICTHHKICECYKI